MTRLFPLAAALILGGCTLPGGLAERGVLSNRPASYARTVGTGTSATTTATRRAQAIESLGSAPGSVQISRSGRVLPVVAGDRLVQLDYTDADADKVAREVVGDVMGLPVSVDPGVQGRITLRTAGRVPVAELPARLDQALAPLGFGIAAIGGRVRVGRLVDLDAPSGGAGGEARLIPITNSGDIINVLQQNAPEGVRLQPTPSGVLVTGPTAGVDAVEELARIFSTDQSRGRSFGIYPLANSSPASVISALQTIFGASSGVRFAAIERLNAVMAVADQPAALARVRRTVAQLDTARAATAIVHVYPVLNRRASDLADLLQRAFGLQQTSQASARNSPAGGFGMPQVQSDDGLGGASGRSSNIPVRLPGAPEVQRAPDPGQAGPQQQDLGLVSSVRIQADNGRNALVVLASAADYEIIEQTIRRLDVRPRQVFIEAVIAEVTLNDQLRYGIDYSLKSGDSTLATIPLLTGSAVTGGLTYLLRGANVGVTLQALSAITDVKVVSAPRVLVVDNETATLQVGDQVPILTRSAQSTVTANAPIVDSVELRDTGVILAVRARIAAGGTVALDVFQEVSNAINTNSSSLNSPTIQLRRLQSAIQVRTGETIALGGLMRDTATGSRSGIPILSAIPYIGALFGTRQQETVRSELLVLLTLRVVEDGVDLRALTDELRAKLNTLAPDLGRGILPPSTVDRFDPRSPPPRGVRIGR